MDDPQDTLSWNDVKKKDINGRKYVFKQILETEYDILDVPGDGNCFFRAVVKYFLPNVPHQLEDILSLALRLENNVEDDSPPPLTADSSPLKELTIPDNNAQPPTSQAPNIDNASLPPTPLTTTPSQDLSSAPTDTEPGDLHQDSDRSVELDPDVTSKKRRAVDEGGPLTEETPPKKSKPEGAAPQNINKYSGFIIDAVNDPKTMRKPGVWADHVQIVKLVEFLQIPLWVFRVDDICIDFDKAGHFIPGSDYRIGDRVARKNRRIRRGSSVRPSPPITLLYLVLEGHYQALCRKDRAKVVPQRAKDMVDHFESETMALCGGVRDPATVAQQARSLCDVACRLEWDAVELSMYFANWQIESDEGLRDGFASEITTQIDAIAGLLLRFKQSVDSLANVAFSSLLRELPTHPNAFFGVVFRSIANDKVVFMQSERDSGDTQDGVHFGLFCVFAKGTGFVSTLLGWLELTKDLLKSPPQSTTVAISENVASAALASFSAEYSSPPPSPLQYNNTFADVDPSLLDMLTLPADLVASVAAPNDHSLLASLDSDDEDDKNKDRDWKHAYHSTTSSALPSLPVTNSLLRHTEKEQLLRKKVDSVPYYTTSAVYQQDRPLDKGIKCASDGTPAFWKKQVMLIELRFSDAVVNLTSLDNLFGALTEHKRRVSLVFSRCYFDENTVKSLLAYCCNIDKSNPISFYGCYFGVSEQMFASVVYGNGLQLDGCCTRLHLLPVED